MAKAKKSSKSSRNPTPVTDVPSAKSTDPAQLRGELVQLAEIRQKFPALSPVLAGAFLSQHGDDDCRALGAGTRAKEIFAGGLRWARTLGENPGDPALSPRRVRWFLDCLTALGDALAGAPVAINPSSQGAWDDAKHQAETRFARGFERVRRAAGSRSAWITTLDAVRTTEGAGETVLARIEALAKAIEGWDTPADLAILDAFDVSAQTVTELRAAAATLDAHTRERGAPGAALRWPRHPRGEHRRGACALRDEGPLGRRRRRPRRRDLHAAIRRHRRPDPRARSTPQQVSQRPRGLNTPRGGAF